MFVGDADQGSDAASAPPMSVERPKRDLVTWVFFGTLALAGFIYVCLGLTPSSYGVVLGQLGAPEEGPVGSGKISRGEAHNPESHLIPLVLRVALGQRESASIFGTDYPTPDGTCIRDYIHILDLARAHMLALEAPKSEFYNLGTGGGSSVREVIDCCERMTGRKIPIVEKPRRPGDPPRLIAASEKIQKELGWRPKFQSLEAIIESAWIWHRKFPNGYGD